MAIPNRIEAEENAERIRAYYAERGWDVNVQVIGFGGGDFAAQIMQPIRYCSRADEARYREYRANVAKASHWAIRE